MSVEHAVLALDFLGFGLSSKPRDHVYSLLWQADLVEDLLRRRQPGRAVFIVAHDMGTSVATELMARDLEGRLDIELAGALLFNGSIVLERASLTPAQRLLRAGWAGSSHCSATSASSASSSAPFSRPSTRSTRRRPPISGR